MDDKTADMLAELLTLIRIELMKGASKEELDRMLYDLSIAIYKSIK